MNMQWKVRMFVRVQHCSSNTNCKRFNWPKTLVFFAWIFYLSKRFTPIFKHTLYHVRNAFVVCYLVTIDWLHNVRKSTQCEPSPLANIVDSIVSRLFPGLVNPCQKSKQLVHVVLTHPKDDILEVVTCILLILDHSGHDAVAQQPIAANMTTTEQVLTMGWSEDWKLCSDLYRD